MAKKKPTRSETPNLQPVQSIPFVLPKVIPAEPPTAFHFLEKFLSDLLFWSTIPDPEPLTSDWIDAMREDIHGKCDSALRSLEYYGPDALLAEKLRDAHRLALGLAALLYNSPDLSTVPRRQWTVPRECQLYDDLAALQHELKKLSSPDKWTKAGGKWESKPDRGEAGAADAVVTHPNLNGLASRDEFPRPDSQHPDDRLVSAEEVSQMLAGNVSAKTLLNNDSKGWGPPVKKIDRSRVWRWGDIKEMVTKKRKLKGP